MKTITTLICTIALLFSVSAVAQDTDDGQGVTRALLLSAEDVAERASELDTSVAYANTTVLEREDVSTSTGIAYRLAVDRRTPPQRAASHTNEAELWAIVEGSGEITTDGRIVESVENGETVRRIEGGTVHRVSAGDFLMIPENVPHQVTGFDPSLLIVTFEFPR